MPYNRFVTPLIFNGKFEAALYFMRFIVWLSQLLLEDATDHKIAAAVVLGLFWGVTPVDTLQWLFALIVACLIRFNLASLILSTLFFWLFGQLMQPLFHAWGLHLLTNSGRLIPLWAWMFHAPILPYTEFYNTLVMGGTAFAILFAAPLYVATRFVLKRYRATFYHAWRTTKIYRTYVIYKEYAR